MQYLGIIFAISALICWGFGDFFIQRTSRDYGIWPSLFCICGAGAIVLFPFVFQDLSSIRSVLPLLFLLSVITLAVALVEFDALKIGKLAVIEPIMSFELPLTVLLSVIILNEHITSLEAVLVAFVFGGILLTGYSEHLKAHHLFERGAILALIATVIMATVNFTTALASQATGPIMTIWFVHTFLAIVCVGYFSFTKTWHTLWKHLRRHPAESVAVAFFDNGAWLSYAAATVLIPISLAITVSESYIVLAVLLGVAVNHERLTIHQWIGVVVSVVSVLTLAFIH